jgi:hypothetical protein
MSVKTRRFVPRVQPLDERALPSVSYDLQGTFLFVHGDDAANQITINDDGTSTGVSVTSIDGNNWAAGTVITHVFVDTQDGNDTVAYNLTGPLSVNRLVDVDLGNGADNYTAIISGTSLAEWVNLDLSAHGRGGKDTLTLNAQQVSTASGSVLNVSFDGDAGKDTIAFNYSVGPSGEFGTVVFTKDQKH